MSPKPGPKDASILIQPRSEVPAQPSTHALHHSAWAGECHREYHLSLPLRHLSHFLGTGYLAGPEEVVSGGVPRTAIGRREGHLRKGKASA